MSVHPLAGTLSVEASARRIRHYRYVEERLMRTLAGWIAWTPELGVKLLFGRHVWDCAQHADLWGRRLPELRAPAQQSEPANDRVAAFMDLLDSREEPHESIERLVGVYKVLKPHLVATYEEHLSHANAIYEPPTRRILARCAGEERRHAAAGAALLERLTTDAGRRERAELWQLQLRQALARAGGVTGLTPDPPMVPGSSPAPDISNDLVAVDPFTPAVIEPDLAAELDAHRRALVAGDPERLRAQLAPAAGADALTAWSEGGDWDAAEVVAAAKVGGYRLVKMRLTGRHGVAIVQTQWRRSPDGWRIVEVELLSSQPS